MISIIIPFHNEEGNLAKLVEELVSALAHHPHEIIFINDGSLDKSAEVILAETKHRSSIKLISYNQRKGKGYALQRGIDRARGDIIMFMDADLQDDPADIPLFLAKLEEGYDVVNGYRKNRQDNQSMKFISKIGNALIWRGLLHSPFHDVNCGFKAFKQQVLDMIPLYGDNFRFLPLLAYQDGYKVTEVAVHNRARSSGKSKYSPRKIMFGMFDTVTTYFIFRFAEKPLHFFGPIGFSFFGVGALMAAYMSFERLAYGILLYRRPALLLAVLLIIIGIQIMMTGIVAELVVYLDKKSKKLE